MQSSKYQDAEVERTTQQVFINGLDVTPITKSYNLQGCYVRVYIMVGSTYVRTKKGKRMLVKLTGEVNAN